MMTNRFPAWCCECRERVLPEQGSLLGKDEATGRWTVRCAACERAVIEEAKRQRRARLEPGTASEQSERLFRQRMEEIDRIRWLLDEAERAQFRRPRCLEVLGLTPPIDAGVVKRRFRELARQSHPDLGGDPAEFIAIRAAYGEAMQLAGGGR
jgi:hypothetical protein